PEHRTMARRKRYTPASKSTVGAISFSQAQTWPWPEPHRGEAPCPSVASCNLVYHSLDNRQLKPGYCRGDKMNLRQVLFSTAAAIGIAAMAVAVPAPASAQQAAVEIDKDDIGGVGTRAKGPGARASRRAGATEMA